MNLNLDFSGVTRSLRGALNQLRQKHILPIALALVAAIVAVPLLLANSSSSPAQPESPAPVPPPPSASTLPALNVESTPAHSALVGRGRDPFTAATGSSAPASVAGTSSTIAPNLGSVSSVATVAHDAVNAANSVTAGTVASSAGSSSTSSNGTTSFSSSSGGSGTSSASFTTPPSTTVTAKPKPSGLTSTQSYNVALSITNSSGGLNAVQSLQRLSVLPSRQQPLLVELGVLKGGSRVLFAVQPGTAVKGPGTCIPGPIDCEVLSLARNQTEVLGRQSANGVTRVALFVVTSIKAVDHSTVAAAQRARQSVSTAGRTLLRNSPLSALSMFRYESTLGAVADLRSLSIG